MTLSVRQAQIDDTIRWKSLTWTRKLSIQLYLAHVARKETKTNNASAPLIQYRLRSVKADKQTDDDYVPAFEASEQECHIINCFCLDVVISFILVLY